MRFAKRVDSNQKIIVEALRGAGAVVEVIHEPVDLKVWADANKQKFMFAEVKNLATGYGRKGPNEKQVNDMAGHAWVTLTDVAGALGALRVLRS